MPGSSPGTNGVHSISIRINGRDVVVSRVFTPANQPGTQQTATMRAQFDGASTISGAGPGGTGHGDCRSRSARTVAWLWLTSLVAVSSVSGRPFGRFRRWSRVARPVAVSSSSR